MCIPIVVFIAILCVRPVNAQTALINGTNAAGTLVVNTTNSYTLTANAGDNLVLRLGSTGFEGRLELYSPNSSLLKSAGGNSDDWQLADTANTTGTYTVRVSSFYAGGTGTYVLHLAQFPEPFIVPSGDQGGPMTNGGNYSGSLTLGDLDMWTFTANTGDNIVLRLGSTGFEGNLDLYGPDGALLKSVGGNSDRLGTGLYGHQQRHLHRAGQQLLPRQHRHLYAASRPVPRALHCALGRRRRPDDQRRRHSGSLSLGDLDLWSFTANAGDSVVLRLGSTGFQGNLGVYGPNGALIKTAGGNSDDWSVAYTATNSGDLHRARQQLLPGL